MAVSSSVLALHGLATCIVHRVDQFSGSSFGRPFVRRRNECVSYLSMIVVACGYKRSLNLESYLKALCCCGQWCGRGRGGCSLLVVSEVVHRMKCGSWEGESGRVTTVLGGSLSRTHSLTQSLVTGCSMFGGRELCCVVVVVCIVVACCCSSWCAMLVDIASVLPPVVAVFASVITASFCFNQSGATYLRHNVRIRQLKHAGTQLLLNSTVAVEMHVAASFSPSRAAGLQRNRT